MAGGPFPQTRKGRCLLFGARNSWFAGIGLNFTAIDPIAALYWSAVINGVLAAPAMALLMVLVRKLKVWENSSSTDGFSGSAGRPPSPWHYASRAWPRACSCAAPEMR
jgi:hypothetical protein